jgi:Cu-processing system ATP-binding protein
MTSAPMVEATGVRRHYGSIRAVDGVDLVVKRGVIFGLLGHNGAGKSTLLRLLLGLERTTDGQIRIDGSAMDRHHLREVRRRIGYLPEQVVLYDNLTGLETLAFFAALKGVPASACPAAIERVGLGPAGRRRVGEYSKGMRQRLALAQALLGSPQLLFLDEPTTALDPEAVRAFYVLLSQLKGEGVTIVLSSHSLAEIQDKVDELAIMVSGRVRVSGTVDELRDHVNLPVTITVTTHRGCAAAVRASLDELPVTILEISVDKVRLRCRRDVKMLVLSALASRRDAVLDLDLREPSLEDVFFGIAD